VLVGLALGDRLGEVLGLGDLQLQLAHPVVALSGGAGLERVLVALGGEVELVGALSSGLSCLGLSSHVLAVIFISCMSSFDMGCLQAEWRREEQSCRSGR
jgi:hypothetical protein